MFDVYLALGDSMSIDSYPLYDAEADGLSCREDIGAAALLYRNDSALYPEFIGKDLESAFPGIEYVNQCVDGATTEDLLGMRMQEVDQFKSYRCLVTLTIGGNDLLQSHRRTVGVLDSGRLTDALGEIRLRYEKSLLAIKRALPASQLILTTVFDPTDGTGIMPSTHSGYDKLPIQYLEQFNNFVRALAKGHKAILADVHEHFRGHGAECDSAANFWYWKASPIEPSRVGAHEIRRVWWEAVAAEKLTGELI